MNSVERKLVLIDKESNVIAAGLVFDYRLAVHQVGLLAVSEALRDWAKEQGKRKGQTK